MCDGVEWSAGGGMGGECLGGAPAPPPSAAKTQDSSVKQRSYNLGGAGRVMPIYQTAL